MRAIPEELANRLLVVLGVGLVEQGDGLEEAAEATLDDLGDRLLRLALVAGDRLQRGPLGLDHLGGDVVTRQVLRSGERDVHGDVVGELLVAAGEDDEHAVHSPSTLDVEVAVDDLAVTGLQPDDLAELDVLLQRDLQVVEARLAVGDGIRALGGDQSGQLLGLELEVLAGGDEVGLAPEGDERADVVVDDEGDDALGRSPARCAWRWPRDPARGATAWPPRRRRRWPRAPSSHPSSRRRWPGADPGRPEP